MLNLMVKLV